MKQLEILAPVGGQQQLIAAVRSGADAVYLGAQGFNARRNAQNFDEAGLPEAVAYCHGRGVKVHVTVNTLVTDQELPALYAEIERIAEAGPDAIIVQDLAVAELFREYVPKMPLHASTQMTIHNLCGAKMLEDMGFSRVVLARELSLTEIAAIAKGTSLEVETFVHGALCMSLSGQCYLSSLIGGRSGNRGLCAQPCRLNYRSGSREYALSLKDMSYITHMSELAEAGVISLKIEGRMKRPEYVAAAVNACKIMRDGGDPDLETLKAVFSRDGFTDGYLTEKRDLSMFGRRTQQDAAESAKVLGSLSTLYRREYSHIPVDMELALYPDSPAQLTLTDGTDTTAVTGEIPQRAINRPTDLESATRALSKTGGTPFVLGNLTLLGDGNLMLPGSALNGLRREGLEALLALRSVPNQYTVLPKEDFPVPQRHHESPKLHIRVEEYCQIPEDHEDIRRITVPIRVIEAHPELITVYEERLCGEIPALVFPKEEKPLMDSLRKLFQMGLRHVCVHNLGALKMARDLGFTLHGGYGLNLLNSYALSEYQRIGLSDATLSFECSMQNIRTMPREIPVGILGYGHLPLMLLRSCPARGAKGCGNCDGHPTLTDRMDTPVPLICQQKRYSVLLNPIPLHLGHVELSGMDFITLYFTRESPEECHEILTDYRLGRQARGPRTGGLYYRELQ